MVKNYEGFKIQMLNKFVVHYPHTELINDQLVITKNNVEASVRLFYAYEEFRDVKNFNLVCNKYLNIVQEEFEKCRFKIDYDKVYPFIKSREFGLEEKAEFVREGLFLNLDILFAMDMGETYRFILKSDDYDFAILKKRAFENLNMFSLGLEKLDKELDIYTIPYPTDYSASYFLLEKMKKIIERKLGKNYLFTISSSTSIFVSRDNPAYIQLLKTLSSVDPDPNRITNKIYVCRNGIYDYAEKEDILRIIK